MQGKKLSVLLIIVVVLVAGWFISVKTVSGVDELNAQNELVEQADVYAAKELYVRAIPLYKEALGYSTDNNLSIQEKLLDTYDKYGDTSSYVELVESRVSAGTAGEQEYLNLATYYFKHSDLEESMEIAKEGVAKFGSSELQEFYDEHRFASYTTSTTKYEKIIPTAQNTTMPAFDGESWVYINSDGRDKNLGSFDTATPFKNGYAVVSVDGEYKTILSSGDLYGIDELGIEDVYYMTASGMIAKHNGKYGYYNYDFESTSTLEYDEITATKDGVAALRNGDKWGLLNSSGEFVNDFTLSEVAVNSLQTVFFGGHAMVKTSSGWQLIDTKGNVIGSSSYYGAKAPESESGYIAVADENGKWGFIDLEGNLVIDYKYDDAKSFSDGLAAVCLGETWEYINDKGDVIFDFGMDDAYPFHNGTAQAHIYEGTMLITLKYFEE